MMDRKHGWGRGVAIVLLTLILAGLAGTHALGTVAARYAPDLALSVMPHNGDALAYRSIATFQEEAKATKGKVRTAGVRAFGGDAEQAFAREPLSVKAVRQKALALEAQGKSDAARKLMFASAKLSHRDDLTNLWLIDWYLKQDNVPQALVHYDMALRTSDLSAATLLPKIALALRNDSLIQPMVDMLAQRPGWARRYWFAVLASPEALPNAARLRIAIAGRGVPVDKDIDAGLMTQLTLRGLYEPALAIHDALSRRPRDASLLMSKADLANAVNLAPFDWTSGQRGGQSGFVNADDRTLELSGEPGSQGTAAYRVAALDPGTYEARVTFQPEDGPKVALQVSCVLIPTAAPVAILSSERGRIAGRFTIDATCRFHKFSLVIAVPGNGASTLAEVTDISLRKL